MGKSKLDPRHCENPDCFNKSGNRTIIDPYNSNHRVCDKLECKAWLLNQSKRKKNIYRFTKSFIEREYLRPKVMGEVVQWNTFANLVFTKDDFEKIEE